MTILNSVLKNRFGKNYKLQLPYEINTQLNLKSEVFWNEESTQQFVNDLTAPEGYWREIVAKTDKHSSSLTTKEIEEKVSELILAGQIKLYPVDIPDIVESPPENRAIRSTDNILYRFAPVSSLLLVKEAKTESFKNIDEVKSFISGLNPGKSKLITIAEDLNINLTESASVNESEIVNSIAGEIISGKIVITADKISSPPPVSSKNTEEKSTVGNRQHVLADEKEEYFTEIEFLHDDRTNIDIAIPYIVTLSDGTKKEGTLDDSGYKHFPDIPAGTVKVEFGYPEAEQELENARKELNGYLDDIISEVKDRAKLLDKELNKLNVLEQGAVLTGAFFVGLYDSAMEVVDAAEMIVESGIDVIVEIDEARQKALDIILSGNIDGAKKELEELVTYGEEQYQDMQETYDTLQLVYSDPELKSTLTEFPKRYLEALPTVEKTGMASGLALNIVFTLVTGGAGGAVSIASKAPKFVKAADKIQEIIVLLKKTKVTKKQSKSHNNKIAENTKKQKNEKLSEKSKKTCKSCNDKYNPKCPLCDSKRKFKGDTTGSSEELEKNIFKYRKTTIEKHPWFYNGKMKNGNARRSIEAHHLIPSETLRNDASLSKICDKFGYDINHYKNGVMLPYYMELACNLSVPLHRGGHTAGKGNPGKSYPLTIADKVSAFIEKVEDGRFCKSSRSPREIFLKKMNNISETAFTNIKDFTWSITSDGIQYKNSNNGCGNADNIGERKGKCKMRTDGKQHIINDINGNIVNITHTALELSK